MLLEIFSITWRYAGILRGSRAFTSGCLLKVSRQVVNESDVQNPGRIAVGSADQALPLTISHDN